MKNEAESYMLRELSLMKWQEKATTLAYEDSNDKMVEMQTNLSSLEENLSRQRYICLLRYVRVSIQSSHFCVGSWDVYSREKIGESNKTLKELEAVHQKYLNRQEVCSAWVLTNNSKHHISACFSAYMRKEACTLIAM